MHFVSKGEGARIVGRGRSVHLGQRMGYGEAATFIVLPAPGAF